MISGSCGAAAAPQSLQSMRKSHSLRHMEKQQRSPQLIRKVGIEKVDEPDLLNATRESRDFRWQLQTQQELPSGLDVVLARRFDLPPPA